jgi:hypothetical protein
MEEGARVVEMEKKGDNERNDRILGEEICRTKEIKL